MMKPLIVLAGLVAMSACTYPDPYYPEAEGTTVPTSAPYYDPYQPVVGGNVYIGSGGSGGRIGISTGNFGFGVGF